MAAKLRKAQKIHGGAVQGPKRLDTELKIGYIFDTKTYINMGQKYYGKTNTKYR